MKDGIHPTGYIKLEYKKQTNADRIRSMSDEELAEWIHNICHGYDNEQEPIVSIYNLDTKKDTELHDSYGDLLNWLQSEVDEVNKPESSEPSQPAWKDQMLRKFIGRRQ